MFGENEIPCCTELYYCFSFPCWPKFDVAVGNLLHDNTHHNYSYSHPPKGGRNPVRATLALPSATPKDNFIVPLILLFVYCLQLLIHEKEVLGGSIYLKIMVNYTNRLRV